MAKGDDEIDSINLAPSPIGHQSIARLLIQDLLNTKIEAGERGAGASVLKGLVDVMGYLREAHRELYNELVEDELEGVF